jgi:hypothetical protein
MKQVRVQTQEHDAGGNLFKLIRIRLELSQFSSVSLFEDSIDLKDDVVLQVLCLHGTK